MERNSFLTYGIVFAGGFLMAVLSYVWFLLNNPHEIKRTAEDKINWGFHIFYGAVNAILGGFVGLGAYFLITYFEVIDSIPVIVFISSTIASASGEIFTILQKKVVRVAKKADEKSDKAIDKML